MSTPDILPQHERENPDPQESGRPVPWPVLVLLALLVLLGVGLIATSSVDTPAVWGDGRVAEELQGRATPPAAAADGAATFAALCAACHQASGAGLPGVFPPLAGSEWVTGKASTLAAIVLHGGQRRAGGGRPAGHGGAHGALCRRP